MGRRTRIKVGMMQDFTDARNFGVKDCIFAKALHFITWIVLILNTCVTTIITSFMIEYGYATTPIINGWKICFLLATPILFYKIFVLAWNDISKTVIGKSSELRSKKCLNMRLQEEYVHSS